MHTWYALSISRSIRPAVMVDLAVPDGPAMSRFRPYGGMRTSAPCGRFPINTR